MRSMVVVAGDPGGANALLPVIGVRIRGALFLHEQQEEAFPRAKASERR